MEQNVPTTATPGNDAGPDPEQLEARQKNGANWFYWIAGLSLVNSVVILAGGEWGFIVGLGITQMADAIGAAAAEEMGAGIGLRAFVFGFDVFVAGLFVLFGVLAGKRRCWAFALGMVLYAADGLLFVMVGDWLSTGFHGFALFCLFSGLMAGRKLAALERPADPALTSQPITP